MSIHLDALEPLQNSRRDLEFAIGGSIVDFVTRGEKGLEKSVASRSLEVLNIFFLLLYLKDFACKIYYNHFFSGSFDIVMPQKDFSA